MRDEDYIIEGLKLQAQELEENGELENSKAILSLINSIDNTKKDKIDVGVSMTATVRKIDGDT